MNELLAAQSAYQPRVEGKQVTAPIIVCGGMGGSSFPVRIARFLNATPYLITHQDYGLPERVPEGAHYVALSYSGETEETLSFAQEAIKNGLPLSVVTGGGALLALAKEHGLSYVEVPKGTVPRETIVGMTKALLALIGQEELLVTNEFTFDTAAAEKKGKEMGELLADSIPVFYASDRNKVLGELMKIFSNETAKVPAFSNVVPEMNHNEMQGYGSGESVKDLARPMVAVFLEDATDDERVQRRMRLTKQLLGMQGVRTVSVTIPSLRTEAVLYTWWTAHTLCFSLASRYGMDPDSTPLIDSFKEML
ncbi:MAG: glucose/mannose-6-phosphate isomerase [Patescibacteria group bacterium]|nr:glucose/mannose-6-phosphate isomerase [Patescibacteria group bacterium]